MTMQDKIMRLWKRFGSQDAGVTAIVFALSVPMFIAAAGTAVDLAQAYNVKNRLGNALDKAALAAASTSGTSEEIEAQVTKFFDANYPDEKLGTPFDITVTLGENTVHVTASARVSTTFMSILGYDYLDVSAETEVVRELGGVEVVLVLDITGSMAGSKITALKNAVCNSGSTTCKTNSFLNIMFTRISDTDYIKVGIVPFSQSVNVGPYGLGVDTTGAAYGTAFVSKPSTDDYITPASSIAYSSTGANNNWMGCITERSYPLDTTDDTSPNWGMYRYPRICSRTRNGRCQSYSNNNPNTGCPSAKVVPMTNNQSTLASAVYSLSTGGNTYGNVGMAWGYHLISHDVPFTEGVNFSNNEWSKTVIMMTDGDNTTTTYAAYGYNASITTDDQDDRFLEVCDNMKADGITIYTISFDDGGGISQSSKNMLETCASGADKYYDAGVDNIGAAFEDIANHLSSLHITQ